MQLVPSALRSGTSSNIADTSSLAGDATITMLSSFGRRSSDVRMQTTYGVKFATERPVPDSRQTVRRATVRSR